MVAGYDLGLRTLGRLEVDDGDFIGLQTPDEVDATVDNDAVTQVHLDLLL